MRKHWKILMGKTEYLVPIGAVLVWLLFAAGGKWFGWSVYPIGYFQKLAFGVVGISVLMGVAWMTMGSWFPKLKHLIDPDTSDLDELPLWERVKIAFWFFALYVGGAVVLASLY